MNTDTKPVSSDSLNSPSRKLKVDKVFMSLLLFLAAINMPFFMNYVLPVHDTMNFFHNFYFFYNELYYNGEFAHWVPYGYYGVQSDFFFISQVPPAYYLSGILGNILAISNAYFLFKATLFFEQAIFLFGVYRLSGRTFKRKATVVFVCLASVGGTALMTQTTFNFREYYFLPLIIYLLLRFFSTYKPQYALSAMLVGIVSLIGGAPYIAAILLLKMTIICSVLFIGNLKALKNIRMPNRRDILLSVLMFALLGFFTVSYHYYIMHALDETVVLSGGRDPFTGVTDLRTFLTYGGDITWAKFSGLWSPYYRLRSATYSVTAFDETIYFGGLTFAFFLYGLIFARRFRNPLYLSVLMLAVVLALFSVGYKSFFAAFMYNWFPLMKYYRHVGYVTASFTFLIPLLAGFGFEHFIAGRESESGKRRVIWESAIIAVFFLSVVFIAGTFKHVIPTPELNKTIAVYIIFAISVVVAMSIVRMKLNLRSYTLVLVIVLYLVEIIGYQYLIDMKFIQFGHRMRPVNEEAFDVAYNQFQPSRTMGLPHKRAQAAFPLVLGTTPYAFGYNFMQWDPCVPKIRVDLINENVAALITLWGDKPNFMRLYLPEKPFLLGAMGCNVPKLRLLSDTVIANGVKEAADIIRGGSLKNNGVVISNVSREILKEWESKPRPSKAAGQQIKVKGFRANGLDIEVEVREGPRWLYYADAYHSGWRATVNGRPQKIARANIAFKAVLVPEGVSSVSFFFDAGATHRSSRVVIAIGTLVMAALLIAILRTLFFASGAVGRGSGQAT